MGPIAFSAQYQQSPIPPGGTIIKRKWLSTYDEIGVPLECFHDLIVDLQRLNAANQVDREFNSKEFSITAAK
jgi:hypothetical protein